MTITVFAVLGGMGVVPTAPSAAEAGRSTVAATNVKAPTTEPQVGQSQVAPSEVGPAAPVLDPPLTDASDPALPADSGTGRRVVFSESEQRVWLVRSDGSVRRTYLVSGSLVDNLDPGTYAVYSRSRWAVGVDDSGVMEYFVRFAHGREAAIGFHTIPTKLGTPLQARSQLGTPQSHGCIRQAKADAISLWKFALEGSQVVVV